MKNHLILFALVAIPWTLLAHDHVEIGLDTEAQSRLVIIAGASEQWMTFFPLGEKPSIDTYAFPGGVFATMLTFSAFDNTGVPENGALVRADLISVSGPAGGSFSFWEVGATAPTWTKPSGWATSPTDKPSFLASEDGTGWGHIHGRVFSTNKPGVYDVTFQAVDATGEYASSNNFTIRFTAITPPQLAINLQGGDIHLSYVSRANLSYDVQSSTTLQPNNWTTIETQDGTGGLLEFSEPLGGRPKVFYRLVEYQ